GSGTRSAFIAPLLLGKRRAIEKVASHPPVRQMLVHERSKPRTVLSFEVVHKLVHHDVLHAQWILLRELHVEPDVACFSVAGAPLGFHLAYRPLRHGDTELGLPS